MDENPGRPSILARLLRGVLTRLFRWVYDTPRKAYVHCGENVVIAPYVRCTYPDRVRLDSHIYIGPHALLSSQGGLTIEEGAILGPFVSIYTANHNYEGGEAIPYDGVVLLRPVTIGRHVWIGANVVILPGATIGEGAVVGAGSVVVGAVPALAVVGGNPARVLKYRDRDHYERMKREGRIFMKLKPTLDLNERRLGDA